MNIIFISGSRHVKKIPPVISKRIDNIVRNGDQVIVGDASGVDSLVQKYLFGIDYKNVAVFCSGEKCRNNIGNWKEYCVAASDDIKSFQFYALKDKEMACYATHGLMIWDGKSFGTILNVLRMTILNKISVLFDINNENNIIFKDKKDWIEFYTRFDAKMMDSIQCRVSKDELFYLESLITDKFIPDSLMNKNGSQQLSLY